MKKSILLLLCAITLNQLSALGGEPETKAKSAAEPKEITGERCAEKAAGVTWRQMAQSVFRKHKAAVAGGLVTEETTGERTSISVTGGELSNIVSTEPVSAEGQAAGLLQTFSGEQTMRLQDMPLPPAGASVPPENPLEEGGTPAPAAEGIPVTDNPTLAPGTCRLSTRLGTSLGLDKDQRMLLYSSLKMNAIFSGIHQIGEDNFKDVKFEKGSGVSFWSAPVSATWEKTKSLKRNTEKTVEVLREKGAGGVLLQLVTGGKFIYGNLWNAIVMYLAAKYDCNVSSELQPSLRTKVNNALQYYGRMTVLAFAASVAGQIIYDGHISPNQLAVDTLWMPLIYGSRRLLVLGTKGLFKMGDKSFKRLVDFDQAVPGAMGYQWAINHFDDFTEKKEVVWPYRRLEVLPYGAVVNPAWSYLGSLISGRPQSEPQN